MCNPICHDNERSGQTFHRYSIAPIISCRLFYTLYTICKCLLLAAGSCKLAVVGVPVEVVLLSTCGKICIDDTANINPYHILCGYTRALLAVVHLVSGG